MARACYQLGMKEKAKDIIDDVESPKAKKYQDYYAESAKMIRGL
jgi:hypothetical protein